jgi:hypothetical protein
VTGQNTTQSDKRRHFLNLIDIGEQKGTERNTFSILPKRSDRYDKGLRWVCWATASGIFAPVGIPGKAVRPGPTVKDYGPQTSLNGIH